MEQNTHEQFMRMAIALSKENLNSLNGGPFGAVIVKDGKVIARSANQVISTCDPTAHAEVSAIRLACKALNSFDLTGADIYTSCEPCPMCLGAIYWARISRIFYANTKEDAASIDFDDHFIYTEIETTLDNRKIPFVQMLRDEAFEAFASWKSSGNKIGY